MPRRERILVTGAAGFVGRHLTRCLKESGREVLGVGHEATGDVRHLDVRDEVGLGAMLSEFRADGLVHLAARTYLPAVYEDPEDACSVNILGTLSLLEAARQATPRARVILVSTCVVYGDPKPEDLPLREDAPSRSVHPYGVHKTAAELLGRRFARDGLDVVVARPFNHIGAGMDPRISVMHFARQIVAAERGQVPAVLRVGNLEARRDFLDVRDVVRAYSLLLDHEDPPSPVNICSGRSIALGDVLEQLISLARIPLRVERDAQRYRPLDVPDLYGDASCLQGATGWQPQISLEQALADILESVRGQSPS